MYIVIRTVPFPYIREFEHVLASRNPRRLIAEGRRRMVLVAPIFSVFEIPIFSLPIYVGTVPGTLTEFGDFERAPKVRKSDKVGGSDGNGPSISKKVQVRKS